MKKTNIQKLVTEVLGYEAVASKINEEVLMKVISTNLSRSEAIVIKWHYGLDGNTPREFEDIPVKEVCAAGIYPTRAHLRRLEASALQKLSPKVLVDEYYKTLS